MTAAGIERQLRDGVTALKLDLPDDAQDRLLRYLSVLRKWNRVYNLTAIREPSRLVSHHLLDSLAVVPHLSGSTIADIGSGAGLPGIPIAISRPDCQVFLVESNHKKGAFLRQAVIELGLHNAVVIVARAETWRPEPTVHLAVSRAFSDLSGFVDAARHMIGRGGVLAAMKGLYPNEELAQLPSSVRLQGVVPLEVPGLRAARHLILLQLTS